MEGNVPHGAVAEVIYWSTTPGPFCRLHVNTPPGYEVGTDWMEHVSDEQYRR